MWLLGIEETIASRFELMVAVIVDFDDDDIFILVFCDWGIDEAVIDVVVSRPYTFILFIIMFFGC